MLDNHEQNGKRREGHYRNYESTRLFGLFDRDEVCHLCRLRFSARVRSGVPRRTQTLPVCYLGSLQDDVWIHPDFIQEQRSVIHTGPYRFAYMHCRRYGSNFHLCTQGHACRAHKTQSTSPGQAYPSGICRLHLGEIKIPSQSVLA